MGWRHKILSSGTVGVGDVQYALGASGEITSPEISEEHHAFMAQHPDFAPTPEDPQPEEPKPAPKAVSKPKAKPTFKKRK